MVFENITTGAVTFVQSFANWDPLISLLIISLIIALLSNLAAKFLTNQKLMKETRDEMKRLQEESKLLKDNPDKMMEKQKEIMLKNAPLLKESFKLMMYTFIPFAGILFLIQKAYAPLGKIAFGMSWFWIYFISTVIFSLILRKLLKVY